MGVYVYTYVRVRSMRIMLRPVGVAHEDADGTHNEGSSQFRAWLFCCTSHLISDQCERELVDLIARAGKT